MMLVGMAQLCQLGGVAGSAADALECFHGYQGPLETEAGLGGPEALGALEVPADVGPQEDQVV